jgi:cytochrome c-type biogenesis protein CcmF
VLAAIVLEFVRGTRAARRSATDLAGALLVAGRPNRRRYGGYIVHAAIVLLALGIAAARTARRRSQQLEPGQRWRIRGYDLTLPRRGRARPESTEDRARLAVSRGGTELGDYWPARTATRSSAGLERGRDPHRLAPRRGPVRDRRAVQRDGSVVLKVLVNPLVDLIWLAGLVFLLGSLIAMWPDAREQRRLARGRARGHDLTPAAERAASSSPTAGWRRR